MKVLIIDDSTAARFMIGKIMREVGATVVEADNGKSALDVLDKNRDADLALVDWNMPVMNGLEFVTKVRQDASYNALKLMMVTTETEMTQVVKALEAGVNEYVMKPFNKDIIVEKLKLLGIEASV